MTLVVRQHIWTWILLILVMHTLVCCSACYLHFFFPLPKRAHQLHISFGMQAIQKLIRKLWMKHTTFQTQILFQKLQCLKFMWTLSTYPCCLLTPSCSLICSLNHLLHEKSLALFHSLTKFLLDTNSCGGVAAVTRVFQRADDKSYFRQVLFYFITYSLLV